MNLSPRDLFWTLAYPLYQLLGTARHEVSHGLVHGLRKQK